MRRPWLLSIVLLLVTAACEDSRRVPPTVAQALRGADAVDVVANNRQIRTIVGSQRIERLGDALARFQDGWTAHGAPVPELILTFRKGGNPVAAYGIGHGYLTTGPSQTWTRPLEDTARRDLLGTLSLQEK